MFTFIILIDLITHNALFSREIETEDELLEPTRNTYKYT